MGHSWYEARSDTIASDKQIIEDDQPSLLAQMLVSWWFYILYYGIGVVIGALVYKDARKNSNLALNIKPIWWGVITFIEPPIGVLAYWVIHYSKLSSQEKNENT